MSSVADLLTEALQACARNGYIRRRVYDGRLHEASLMACLVEEAHAAGVDASLVELTASNYPLADRDRQGYSYPSDYQFQSRYFLEAGGCLVTIRMENHEALSVRSYSSRARALREFSFKPVEHLWEICEDEPGPGEQDALKATIDLPMLKANLAAAHLSKTTPLKTSSSRKARL